MADVKKVWYKAVMICSSSFFICLFVMGIIMNFGVMLPTFLDEFNAGRTLTALIGSCQYSLMLLLSPVAGSLIDRYGLRRISFAGGFLYSVGLLSASYVNTIYGLLFTYTSIFAVPASLLYTSVFVSPVKCMPPGYRGIASAIMTCGGQTGMLSFSLLITFLLEQFYWKTMFRIFAYFGVIICLLSLTYGWTRETPNSFEEKEMIKIVRKSFCDTSLCKLPRFLVFMLGSAVSMLGWATGNFFLADRAKTYGIHENKSKWFYFIIGIVSIPSALIAGKIADFIKHRVMVTIICLFLYGLLTMLSYLCKTYITMLAYSFFSGIIFSTYNATLCLAIMDCVGAENIAQASGFLNFFQGISSSVGPPIAGLLRDTTGTFKIPLIVAGCFLILGAFISLPCATIQRAQPDSQSNSCAEECAVV